MKHDPRADREQTQSLQGGGAARQPPFLTAFEHRRLAVGLSTGLLAGLLALVASVTSTLFIFAGPLQDSFPVGLAMTLTSSVIFAAVSAASGSRSFAILRTQEVAIANLGVMALALHASMKNTRSHEEIEATVIALCSLGAALVGLGLYAIGRFSLTRYLRFVPDCVISGYLASVGFLLLKSGVLALTGAAGFESSLGSLSDPDAVSRLCAGGFLALLLLLVESRSQSRLAAPLLILAAIGLFQIVIHSTGLSIDRTRAARLGRRQRAERDPESASPAAGATGRGRLDCAARSGALHGLPRADERAGRDAGAFRHRTRFARRAQRRRGIQKRGRGKSSRRAARRRARVSFDGPHAARLALPRPPTNHRGGDGACVPPGARERQAVPADHALAALRRHADVDGRRRIEGLVFPRPPGDEARPCDRESAHPARRRGGRLLSGHGFRRARRGVPVHPRICAHWRRSLADQWPGLSFLADAVRRSAPRRDQGAWRRDRYIEAERLRLLRLGAWLARARARSAGEGSKARMHRHRFRGSRRRGRRRGDNARRHRTRGARGRGRDRALRPLGGDPALDRGAGLRPLPRLSPLFQPRSGPALRRGFLFSRDTGLPSSLRSLFPSSLGCARRRAPTPSPPGSRPPAKPCISRRGKP